MTQRFGRNLRSWLRWRNAGRDVLEEMALHVELRVAELEARGVPPAEALARARREVGEADAVSQRVATVAAAGDRASALRQAIAELGEDTRHAWRVFRRSRGFSLLAISTIAVALGANAAIFSIVNTLYFRPLPFDPHGNLVRVREFRTASDGAVNDVDASRRTADAVAARRNLFTLSTAMVSTARAVLQGDTPAHVQATRIGPGFSDVIGLAPAAGRLFTADEERRGGTVVVISYRFWQTALAGSPSAIGSQLRLDNGAYDVIGVLPPAFHVPYDCDLWFPSPILETERSVFILARLAPGVSAAQATGALAADAARLNTLYPETQRGLGIKAVGARDFFRGRDDRVALVLMAAVGLLLLIGCANVSLLLTTRFAGRRREVAVRAALGCGRGRQIRQFVTEALLLFISGGAIGLMLAAWIKDAAAVFLPRALATQVGFESVTIDARVAIFAAGLSVGTGVVFGLIAALRATRTALHDVMKDSGRGVTGGASRATLRALASTEIALALILVTGAALMLDAFNRLQRRDLGFEPRGLVTLQVQLPAPRYAEGAARVVFADRLLESVRALPGVEAAAATTVNPICCGDWGARASVEGRPAATQADLPLFQHQFVTAGYFETMGIRVLQGRAFTAEDAAGRLPVAVVDERAARRFWPGQNPIGKRVKRGLPDGPQPWLTVVGVAAAIEDAGEYADAWYLPYAQDPTGPSTGMLHLMVRAADPLAQVAAIKAAAAAINPALPLYRVATMESLQSERLDQDRLGAVATALFAIAGALLAAIGIYAVLVFVLAGETREIGVRLALGATRGQIARHVAARGLGLASWGLLAGVPLAGLVALLLQRAIPEAQAATIAVAVATATVSVTAIVATVLPAARAVRITALEALRAD